MSPEQRVEDLSKKQKDDILIDLFHCLDLGRLLDFVCGWEQTKKGNYRSKASVPLEIEAPVWLSLVNAEYL